MSVKESELTASGRVEDAPRQQSAWLETGERSRRLVLVAVA